MQNKLISHVPDGHFIVLCAFQHYEGGRTHANGAIVPAGEACIAHTAMAMRLLPSEMNPALGFMLQEAEMHGAQSLQIQVMTSKFSVAE